MRNRHGIGPRRNRRTHRVPRSIQSLVGCLVSLEYGFRPGRPSPAARAAQRWLTNSNYNTPPDGAAGENSGPSRPFAGPRQDNEIRPSPAGARRWPALRQDAGDILAAADPDNPTEDDGNNSTRPLAVRSFLLVSRGFSPLRRPSTTGSFAAVR